MDDSVDTLPPEMLETFLAPETPPISPKRAPPSRFASAKTNADVAKAKEAAVCEKTQRDTKWCVGIWQQWSQQRDTSSTDTITDITANPVDIDSLPQWLFVHFGDQKAEWPALSP